MEIWRLGQQSTLLLDSEVSIPGIGMFQCISINGNMSFPYLDIHLSWNITSRLNFNNMKNRANWWRTSTQWAITIKTTMLLSYPASNYASLYLQWPQPTTNTSACRTSTPKSTRHSQLLDSWNLTRKWDCYMISLRSTLDLNHLDWLIAQLTSKTPLLLLSMPTTAQTTCK